MESSVDSIPSRMLQNASQAMLTPRIPNRGQPSQAGMRLPSKGFFLGVSFILKPTPRMNRFGGTVRQRGLPEVEFDSVVGTFWSVLMCFDVSTKDGVDARLVPPAFVFEPVEDIWIKTEGD